MSSVHVKKSEYHQIKGSDDYEDQYLTLLPKKYSSCSISSKTYDPLFKTCEKDPELFKYCFQVDTRLFGSIASIYRSIPKEVAASIKNLSLDVSDEDCANTRYLAENLRNTSSIKKLTIRGSNCLEKVLENLSKKVDELKFFDYGFDRYSSISLFLKGLDSELEVSDLSLNGLNFLRPEDQDPLTLLSFKSLPKLRKLTIEIPYNLSVRVGDIESFLQRRPFLESATIRSMSLFNETRDPTCSETRYTLKDEFGHLQSKYTNVALELLPADGIYFN